MGTDQLKGKKVVLVGPWNVQHVVRSAILEHRLPPLLAVHRIAEPDPMPIPQRLVMHLKAYEPEPMPHVRLDKTKDRFSFADRFVGRGKGPWK